MLFVQISDSFLFLKAGLDPSPEVWRMDRVPQFMNSFLEAGIKGLLLPAKGTFAAVINERFLIYFPQLIIPELIAFHDISPAEDVRSQVLSFCRAWWTLDFTLPVLILSISAISS